MVAMAGHHVMVIVLISVTLLVPSCSAHVTITPRSDTECGIPSTGLNQHSHRIVGGTQADECEYPWMAYLKVDDFTCGGTILDKRHVLTAAHCVIDTDTNELFSPDNAFVLVGSSNSNGLSTYPVENIIAHPKYNNTVYTYDAAVLKLAEDLEFSECVAPVCLPEKGVEVRDTENCVVTGWGVTDPWDDDSAPDDLLEVEVPIIEESTCRINYGEERVAESSLCAGEWNGGKDSCQGDSGGPLMCLVGGRYFVHGIVSNGDGCAEPEFPGIYTRVAHPEILNFIKSAI